MVLVHNMTERERLHESRHASAQPNYHSKNKKQVSFCLARNDEREMVSSILDNKDTHMLGFPLTVAQQIWLLYLIPALFLNIVYVFDLATDLAIGIQLLREGNILTGLVTLVITYAPPFIILYLRLAKPPQPPTPGKIFIWLLIEFTALLLYPLRPLFCFGERIFWAIEALRQSDPQREEALIQYEATENRMMESYLFLQAFIQAGPQAVFQLSLLITRHTSNEHTEEMQAICLISSLITLSIVTANYHRYESQAKGGRKRVLGNAPPNEPDNVDVSDIAARENIRLPVRSRWIKAMAEDAPLGKVVLFFFWFLFLLARILCLGFAAYYYPFVVLGVCVAHYILFFIYILPSPNFTASLPTKIFLPFVFIFCLIEVSIQFAKPGILYTLFYLVTIGENLGLTIVWVIWAKWNNTESNSYWHHYGLYVIGITHIVSFVFLVVYIRYYRPKVKRMRPRSQGIMQEETPLTTPLPQAPPPPHETYID